MGSSKLSHYLVLLSSVLGNTGFASRLGFGVPRDQPSASWHRFAGVWVHVDEAWNVPDANPFKMISQTENEIAQACSFAVIRASRQIRANWPIASDSSEQT